MQNRCNGWQGKSDRRKIEVLRSLVVHRIYFSMRRQRARFGRMIGRKATDLFDYTCNSCLRNLGGEYSLLVHGIQ